MAAAESRAAYSTMSRELQVQREKIGFWMHFSAFLLVNGLIAAINLLYTPGVVWFIFVLFPWGIGVAAHFIGAFYLAPVRLREKEIAAQNPSFGGAAPPS